jgi:hypothetical protein
MIRQFNVQDDFQRVTNTVIITGDHGTVETRRAAESTLQFRQTETVPQELERVVCVELPQSVAQTF